MRSTFRGGVHPLHGIHEGKPLSKNSAITELKTETVVIPVGMHLGAPSTPCVKKGDRVLVGQIIAEPVGFLGVPVHASVSGTVKAVEPRQQLKGHPELCIEIENDGLDESVEFTPKGDIDTVEPAVIIAAVKEAGIVGMGGAAFPTAVKLAIPEGKKAETVIINGAECEPYLTCDYRLMMEQPERIVNGLRLLMRAAGVSKGVIAVESNKRDCAEVLSKAAEQFPQIEVSVLPTKYPQGGEKQLINVVTGRQVPQGKLPIDVGALVFNVQTTAAVADAVLLGKPLYERITTVSGAVNSPVNLRLRVGTLFSDAIKAAGGFRGEPAMIISGGPMTGFCCQDDSVSVTKAGGGILVYDASMAKQTQEGACIRCGKCVSACPMGLMPYQIKFDAEKKNWDMAKKHNAMDCIACGACSYSCPAKRYLTAACKVAKEMIADRDRRAKQ
ncbi:MAG: electron transport complex subunit RsxC [Clostridia bacterium]|nr:electron transport complex subunit RsxC [Clostridia bacterium]